MWWETAPQIFSVLEVQTDNIHIVHCWSCQKTWPRTTFLKSWFKLYFNVGGGGEICGWTCAAAFKQIGWFFFYLCIISSCFSNGVRGLKKSSDPIDFPVVGWSQKVFIFVTCRLRLSWCHGDVFRVAFSIFEFLQETNPSKRTKRSKSNERLYWWGRNCWDPACFRVWLILSNHHRFALCRCIYFGNSVYEDLSPTKAFLLLFILFNCQNRPAVRLKERS